MFTTTWAKRDELRFLYLILAFALVVAFLVVIPPHRAADAASPNVIGGVMDVEDSNTTGANDWTTSGGVSVRDDTDQTLVAGATPEGGIATTFPNEICTTGNDLSLASSKINSPSVTIDPDGSDGYPTPQPTPKTDLCQFYLSYETNGSIFLNVGVVKYKSEGDLSVFVELNQSLGSVPGSFRQAGDVLLEFDWGGGSGAATVNQYRWNGSSWDGGLPTLPAASSSSSPERVFGEAAVEITSLFPAPTSPDACERFGAATLWGKTGNSLNAELKDVIGPAPIDLSNCNKLTVRKDIVPDTAGTFSFPFTVDDQASAWSTSDTLDSDGDSVAFDLLPGTYEVAETIAGISAGFDFVSVKCGGQDTAVADITSGDTTCVITNSPRPTLSILKSTNPDGDAQSFAFTSNAGALSSGFGLTDASSAATSGYLPPGSYTVTEGSLDHWTLTGASCTGFTDSDSDNYSLADQVLTVNLEYGDAVTCTFTNERDPRVMLKKNLPNDDGGNAVQGDFTPSVGGSATTWDTWNWISANTTTAISETTLSGYTPGLWSCDNQVTPTNGDPGAATISVDYATDVTCQITNDDQPGSLTLVKKVVKDNGGTAVLTDFGIGTNAGTPTWDAGTTVDDTTTYTSDPIAVSAGTYSLSESDVFGYTEGDWFCDDANSGAYGSGSVTVGLDEDVTCVITNNDIAPKLTLKKKLVLNNNGAATDTDFTLTATGGTVTISGVEGDADITNRAVPVDTYVLTESTILTGYAAQGWSCDVSFDYDEATDTYSVDLTEGMNATCEATNADTPGTLIVEKTVINDDGGSATVGTFGIKLGANPITFSSPGEVIDAFTKEYTSDSMNVAAGDYTLSELNVDGYAEGSWRCDNSETSGSYAGMTVSIDVGESVKCWITNDDIAPTLTLVKKVTNDDGGTAVPGDWTLTANDGGSGPDLSGTTGVSGDVLANAAYALAESGGPDGYTNQGYVCTGSGITASSASSVTLALAADVTCTITNDDIAPTLTLVKTVTNDDGGTAVPGDWTLTANDGGGGADLSGTTGVNGDVEANAAYALAESDGPAGYAAGSWACYTGYGTGDQAPFVGQSDSSVTLDLGDDVTCVIDNDDIAPTLTLVKKVTNDDGGTAVAGDWTLSADDGGSGADLSGKTGVTGNVLANAAYALAESGGPDGYGTQGYVCTGTGILASDATSVTLDLAAAVTCTIDNDDLGSSITVVKEFENDTEVLPDDFDLTITHGEGEGETVLDVLSGQANDLDANVTYTVGETVLDGWTQTGLACEDGDGPVTHPVNLGLDHHVTCTVTNGENPTVTVMKQTDLETDDLFEFDLDGDTEDVASGGSHTWEMLTPGDYTLVENLTAAEWELEGYECTGVEYTDTAGNDGVEFTLDWGDHVTCVFGNDTTLTDLAVTKVDVDDPINLNPENTQDEITYTIVVTNNGPADATGVTAVDTLPSEVGEHLTFISAVSEQGTCTEAVGVVTCVIGDMAAGASVEVTVTLRTWVLEEGVSRPAFVDNTVTVDGDQPDPNPGNNTDDERTFITEVFPLKSAEVYLAKTDLVDPINLNPDNPTGVIEYVITVGNRSTSPIDATGVVVSDTLPATTTFISATPSKGSCSHAAGVVTCQVGTLAIGETMTINIKVGTETLGSVTKITVLNVATVTLNELDDPSDNTDDEETSLTEVFAELPETGANADLVALVAAVLMLVGTVLIQSTKREEGMRARN